MAATPSVLAVVLGHNRSKARTLQVVLSCDEAAEHLSTASATRCALPAVLGLPLVMVPLGEDLRQPNKAATYLLAAPATGTPPHSVGGTVLVLRADLRDFALRDYHRWWAFLSETLLPLYVVRPMHSQDDRDRATVLDRCAPACLRFVAGLADGARPRPRHAHLLDAAAAGPSKAASPDTPRSVLPWRRSLSSPASTYISPSGPAAEPPLCEAAATAAALLAHKDQPGTKWGVSGPHWGHREPAEAACCADAAWFRQRLASNCVV